MKKIWNKLFPKIIEANLEHYNVNHIGYRNTLKVKWSNNKTSTFVSNNSVDWYSIPTMQSCGMCLQEDLRYIERYIDFNGNPYPTSHLQKKT